VWIPKKVAPELDALQSDELTVLEHAWHSRKLPRGALAGNRFVLVLRGIDGGREAIDQRLQAISNHGVPNYFGEQRFGRGGTNVARAQAMFAGARVGRHPRGLYLSAARAWLFNRVLARRVADASWDGALDGEAFTLAGSRSFFVPGALDDELARRLAEGDVHPSGPLWGAGELPTRGAARALEEAVAGAEPELARGLAAAGLRQERRALRLLAQELRATWLDATTLRLEFALPAGSFATALLRELVDYRAAVGVDE
jgi:tRNA pseudouridine13 synthase